MHLGELELGLSAHPLWKRSVADDISKRLSAFTKKKVINQPSSKLFLQTEEGVCAIAYLSGSCFSNTLRLVWSRTTRALMKPARSSVFDRNCDMLS